jgi:hypothetical protein
MAHDEMRAQMPVYYFRISMGPYSGAAERVELADHAAAWDEMSRVCGDLVGGITRNMQRNSEWRMELRDEDQKPLFRMRLVAETLE